MTNNKTIGNQVERAFATLMHNEGWWVHIFATKVVGQPFDVIAANQGIVWFVDVKNVQDGDALLHSRMEANQINAMKMLQKRAFKTIGFVCLFDDGWYLLLFDDIDFTRSKTTKDKMKKIVDVNKVFMVK